MQLQISTTYDNCMNFLNHQHNQIIDIFLWDTQFSPKCKFLHFNASQWDSSWGMDLTERDFDIVCKKFMTVCLTQCPVPEVIYLLQTFTVLWPCLQFYRATSAVVWLKEIFPAAFDGKIKLEEPHCSSFLPVHAKVWTWRQYPCVSYCTLNSTAGELINRNTVKRRRHVWSCI